MIELDIESSKIARLKLFRLKIFTDLNIFEFNIKSL